MTFDLETKNAIITEAQLATEDHGVLSAWITLDYGGVHQGFGGYCLYNPHRPEGSVAGTFIYRTLQMAGVGRWDELVGKTIRVRSHPNGVQSIGHIVKDEWFCPAEEFRSAP
jgi:hypothetical protein